MSVITRFWKRISVPLTQAVEVFEADVNYAEMWTKTELNVA